MSHIETLAGEFDAEWAHITESRRRAAGVRETLVEALSGLNPADTSVVVFGSLARGEVTSGSDIDWTLLVDGQAVPQHFDASQSIEAALYGALDLKPPGREGTFGGLAFSHEIVHRIGGGDDSNRNTTQRILLLLESCPIGDDEAYERVLRAVTKRYLTEDYGLIHRITTVPRFLQNDIARYWRTVAVDFAYKRRERQGSGWALRTVKLRMSRKLTYASGLLVCFAPALGLLPEFQTDSGKEAETLSAIQPLLDWLRLTPLDRLAYMSLLLPGIKPATFELFSAYDDFLGMLNDPDQRKHLEHLAASDADSDSMYQNAREVGHRFQAALNDIFFGDDVRTLTHKYGVF